MGMYEKDGIGMFHGRLIMLAGLGLVGFAALTTQLGRLSFHLGPGLRDQAESRLERLAWEPTVRGRILDRTGRVLAQDRPTFDVRIDYSVLSGSWAEARSIEFARQVHRAVWRELAPEQRDALARGYEPYFDEHVEHGLAELALVAGVPLEAIVARKAEVLEEVETIRKGYVDRRREQIEDRALARGEELSKELVERQANRPVAEQKQPHTIIPQVEDAVGFAVLALRERTTVLEAPVHDLEGNPTGTLARTELPLVPRLDAGHSRNRQYPYSSITTEIDRSTLPGPLKGDGGGRGGGSIGVTVKGTMDAIIGSVRDTVHAEDPKRREDWLKTTATPEEAAIAETSRGVDRGRYMEGDHVGHTGVEAKMEHTLRGLRGLRVRRLDTGKQTVIERTPGRDVTLTLDAMLQARIAAILAPEVGLAVAQGWHGNPPSRRDDGQPLAGAAVVIDIESGEVLALVSTPTIDPDDPAGSATRPEGVETQDWDDPRFNRATSAVYPPGSIAKALTLTWAASRGEQELHERIECTGHFLPGREDILRCWIWRSDFGFQTHSSQLEHDPDEAEALMCSCNIYFYTLGSRLGPQRMLDAYRAFGAGDPPLDAVGSAAGILGPMTNTSGDDPTRGLTNVDAALMGIGQGPIAWSPLHAADAFATLARGGKRLGPTLVRGDEPPPIEDIGLDPAAVERALRGLWLSVNDPKLGTGNHTTIRGERVEYFNAPGVDVWGKTGTAQAVATLTKELRIAPNGNIIDDPDDEPPGTTTVFRPVKSRYTHAWFVGLVGPEGQKPKYSISVMMEFAGSGGRVSGPIANQVIHALQAQGYLPGGGP
ncbi:MAG: penicillin-binding transpeptidase domain-containing protein [Phycisphaera sp.]|nr:MAG: penicillin-binding transpeptidase domain-containing protein [Phycisphaera sp.]